MIDVLGLPVPPPQVTASAASPHTPSRYLSQTLCSVVISSTQPAEITHIHRPRRPLPASTVTPAASLPRPEGRGKQEWSDTGREAPLNARRAA